MNSIEDTMSAQSESGGFETRRNGIAVCCYANAVLLLLIAVYFFLIPFVLMVYYLVDPAIKDRGISRFAVSVHRSISPKYERWAHERIKSGRAADLNLNDIAGTEWPVFGSFFYLLGTEEIQKAWESDNNLSPSSPKTYAAGTIEAAAALVADPGHATWVKTHWGEDYLHDQNVFYRMLLMGGLTSYFRLCQDDKYLALIEDQAESLSQALDRSPHGLLDDYPRQCFPSDVLAAIAVIKRADIVLNTDHSDFVKRSIRGFSGKLLDATGLPPFFADARTGAIGMSRGCSSQWATMWAAELWPKEAEAWYRNFEEHFWQEKWGAVGFREYPRHIRQFDWSFDVDAGPVLAGFGASASAFGLGTARANGRIDHAYPLTAQTIVVSWPLLDGTLLIPRLLSNATDAPYIGEVSLLFALTREPTKSVNIVKGGRLPKIVYLILASFFGLGLLLTCFAVVRLKRQRKLVFKMHIPSQTMQLIAWATLVALAFTAFMVMQVLVGVLFILFAQLFPIKLNWLRGKSRTQA